MQKKEEEKKHPIRNHIACGENRFGIDIIRSGPMPAACNSWPAGRDSWPAGREPKSLRNGSGMFTGAQHISRKMMKTERARGVD